MIELFSVMCISFSLFVLHTERLFKKCVKRGLEPPEVLTNVAIFPFIKYIKEKSQLDEFSWLKKELLLMQMLLFTFLAVFLFFDYYLLFREPVNFYRGNVEYSEGKSEDLAEKQLYVNNDCPPQKDAFVSKEMFVLILLFVFMFLCLLHHIWMTRKCKKCGLDVPVFPGRGIESFKIELLMEEKAQLDEFSWLKTHLLLSKVLSLACLMCFFLYSVFLW